MCSGARHPRVDSIGNLLYSSLSAWTWCICVRTVTPGWGSVPRCTRHAALVYLSSLLLLLSLSLSLTLFCCLLLTQPHSSKTHKHSQHTEVYKHQSIHAHIHIQVHTHALLIQWHSRRYIWLTISQTASSCQRCDKVLSQSKHTSHVSLIVITFGFQALKES